MAGHLGNVRACATRRLEHGFAFVVVPLVFVFAFDPDLPHPRILGREQLIDRARGLSASNRLYARLINALFACRQVRAGSRL